MVELGHQKIWDGPVDQIPWWWSVVLQIEKRAEALYETAAYDPDKLPPPKDLFPVSRRAELDDYLEGRRELGERRAKEKRPLDDWNG
jgi:hypothetical protein